MEFFNAAVELISSLVVGIGAALGCWGIVNLLEAYGSENPSSKSQGIKQFVAGGGVCLVGLTLIPMLSNIFSG